ncbi:MAG: alpha/beta fold hydrolase [Deltaproteobacteria bacterium]|nr:alpha/beta fold hydrolase [Deltaproteobacteria bacterium]
MGADRLRLGDYDMSEMRQHYVRCLSPEGFHRMAYTEWGDTANPKVLVCVHGLTRVGRDFDFLAAALADDFRVVCPDVVGRGRSDWLKNKALYGIQQYCADMASLLARLNAEQVDWLGTSMGGLIGMTLAAQSNTPIARLILNDVGPLISAEAIARIAAYVGKSPRFVSQEDAEAYVRYVHAPFGNLSCSQWGHLALHSTRPAQGGAGYEMAYDPGIAEPFRQTMSGEGAGKDVELWPLYDAITCPTLVLRGEHSDLLSRETVAAMAQRGPKAHGVEVPGVGHAPPFMDGAQITLVEGFLLA